jgi:hypothetical protein
MSCEHGNSYLHTDSVRLGMRGAAPAKLVAHTLANKWCKTSLMYAVLKDGLLIRLCC